MKMLNKQEAAMKRERALAYAFSRQVCLSSMLTLNHKYIFNIQNWFPKVLGSVILHSQRSDVRFPQFVP